MSTRVLIVEDDRSIARLLRDNLEYEGFEVEWASTGAEALAKAQAFAPALVLLDLMLPPGIDGYELMTRLQKQAERFGARVKFATVEK